MQAAELRRRLGAILAAEEADPPDWTHVEGLSRKLQLQIDTGSDAQCPLIVHHFLSDADIRAKDRRYAEGQRKVIGLYVTTGQCSDSRPAPRWIAWLLLPILLPLSLIARLWLGRGSVDRSPGDVVALLRRHLDGTAGDRDWDEFESVPIRDRELEELRLRALLAGPPDSDLSQLRVLLQEAEAIAQRRL